MADSVVRVTQQGLGGRLGGSIKGALVGVLLAVVAVPLLFWNEGRAVKRARTLAEGAGKVVTVPAAAVDASREGALVHTSGQATTDEVLRDPTFGIERNALSLERRVEMFQWVQKEERKERKKLGGGTETVTTYTYSTEWGSSPVDSASFEESAGHENPSFPFEGETWRAADVRLGAFHLAPELAGELDEQRPVPVTAAQLPAVEAGLRERLKAANGNFYLGESPNVPKVGDVRVSFRVVEPAQASVVAAQRGGRLEPYHAEAGGDIALVSYGAKSAEQMFQAARTANAMLTWILRFVGFILLFVGVRSLLAPLQVAADVVPIFGRLVGAGLSLAAFLVAAPVALVTVGIGWLFYRPLLGIALLALAVGFVVWLVRRGRKPAPAMGAPVFVPPPPPAPAS
ncbi:MAG TPA: TMEM43 family protein [Thermoanaerobaculia bacterium]|nr:TMEM43 family protein [Thermoanaerobaculia bacterium]